MNFVLFAVSTPFAAELAETAHRAGLRYVAVRNHEASVPVEIPETLDADQLSPELLALPFAVPQTGPAQRRDAVADARRRGFSDPLTLVDPTAHVAASAVLGAGCYVGTGSVIGAGARLSDGALVNRSCSVGHHTQLEEFASTGPGVVLAGACRVQAGAFLGAGAVIAPGLTIGAKAVVGAGAVVIRDVEPGQVVVGNPARVLKRDHP